MYTSPKTSTSTSHTIYAFSSGGRGRVCNAEKRSDGLWYDDLGAPLASGSAIFQGAHAERDAYLWGWTFAGGLPHPKASDLVDDYVLSHGVPTSARRWPRPMEKI